MTTSASTTLVQSYLFFEGRCEEAVEYYRAHLGAEILMLMRMKDSPEPHQGPLPPDAEKKVMHVSFKIGETTIMASDGFCKGTAKFEGFRLSLTVADAPEADRVFAALSGGGEVQMPLGKTFWSPYFGMVTDRFGVGWMVTLPA